MTEETAENEHYPWARALMIIVLYGALLIFLWYFPTEGGREFFQKLFNGFLYGLAALVLIAVTVVVFLSFPIPSFLRIEVETLEEPLEEDEDATVAPEFFRTVFPGRVVMVPALREPEREAEVWSVLYEVKDEFEPVSSVLVDAKSGIIGVLDEEPGEAGFLMAEIQQRLVAADIAVRCLP